MSQKIKITEEQAQAMGEEYRTLLEQASAQLVEYKMYLHNRLRAMAVPQNVLQAVDEMSLAYTTVEPGIKDGGEKEERTVSVCYEMPDVLHDFLSQSGLPDDLSIIKQGGITLDVKPIAEKA